ncbi:unnamed protein product [Boreogadus saida]
MDNQTDSATCPRCFLKNMRGALIVFCVPSLESRVPASNPGNPNGCRRVCLQLQQPGSSSLVTAEHNDITSFQLERKALF